MMKILLLYSYFVDGFAYAGEALSGRYIGAGDRNSLVKAVKVIFLWGGVVGVIATIGYWFAGDWLFRLMSADPVVLERSKEFLLWLPVMPLLGCAAFVWDGIYIGATATKAIRNSMLWAVAGFFLCYFIFREPYGVHSLWIGYMAHLVARAVYLTVAAKKEVFEA
jgi:MATE family multidrug resistance protein